jgi:molybdate transport system substrate-binding protein
VIRNVARLGLALLLAASTSGCTTTPGAANLTLYVASSLTDAVGAATAEYKAAHPRLSITQSNGSSTALRTQIEQGAPADVLLSADLKNPQALFDGGLADGGPVNFAANRLAIVVPKGNPAGLASAFDLGRAGVRVVAAGDEVPITGYTTSLLQNLAAQPGAPAGLVAAYAANVVSREVDVRSLLAKVELGEADAGVVYATDARSSDRVDSVPIPAAAQVSAPYSGVVTKTSKATEAAHAFLAWLASPAGQARLADFGFSPP